MSENPNAQTRTNKARENIFGAISVGFFFIMIGIVYINTPSLGSRIVDFFSSITSAQVANTGLTLPAPAVPAAHAVLYGAVFQFALGIAILGILMLVLRLLWRSPLSKIAEAIGNLVFWFGVSYLVSTYLNNTTTMSQYFVFWAGVLMMAGLSMVVRGFVLLTKRI